MRPAPVIVDLYINSGKGPELSPTGVRSPVPIREGLHRRGLEPPGDRRTSGPSSAASDITAGEALELQRTVVVLRPPSFSTEDRLRFLLEAKAC